MNDNDIAVTRFVNRRLSTDKTGWDADFVEHGDHVLYRDAYRGWLQVRENTYGPEKSVRDYAAYWGYRKGVHRFGIPTAWTRFFSDRKMSAEWVCPDQMPPTLEEILAQVPENLRELADAVLDVENARLAVHQ